VSGVAESRSRKRPSDPSLPEVRARASKGRPRIEESLDRDVLNALLSAAGKCLENSETSRITVRQVAEIAGVNQAMINYYFDGKDGLFSSFYERDHQELTRKLNKFLKSVDDGDGRESSIESLMELIEDHFHEHRGLFVLMHNNIMDENSALNHVYMQRLAGRGYSSVVRIVVAFMRKGLCRTDITPEHAAYFICSLCAIPSLLSPIFDSAFHTKASGEEQTRRRRAAALLLAPLPQEVASEAY
jgi:AcrR family transcriptional regulator